MSVDVATYLCSKTPGYMASEGILVLIGNTLGWLKVHAADPQHDQTEPEDIVTCKKGTKLPFRFIMFIVNRGSLLWSHAGLSRSKMRLLGPHHTG